MDPYWHIQLLGHLCVSREGQEITHFRTRKTAAVLACLAYHVPKPHSRDALVEMLWPEMPVGAGRNSLSVALNSLRRQLEPASTSAGSILIAGRSQIALNPDAVEVDAIEFVAAARNALQSDSATQSLEAIATAADRYSGSLLPDHYEPWVGDERDRLSDLYLGLLRRLIKGFAQVREHERALDYAHRAVLADPLREEFHRSVMRLYVMLGRPAAALEQFADLERRLQETLGTPPSSGTRELAAQIAAGSGVSLSAARALSVEAVPKSAPAPPAASAGGAPAPQRADNLPPQFTRFFGRETEIDALLGFLTDDLQERGQRREADAVTAARGEWDRAGGSEARLVTLTGLGGTGKTRLALEAARRVRTRFPGGVWFVPLADLTEADSLYAAIRTALALPHHPDTPPLDAISAALSTQRALLVLDNFEQLVASATGYIVALLKQIPTLQLLMTSRQALEIAGEQEMNVAPLPVPRRAGTLERLLEFASVQMFVNRAQLRRADFQITRKNAAMIARLCERLEGLPLAIELAAAWVKVLTPEQMAPQLEHRMEFLVSQRADLPARHRTLRAVMESSYRLLAPDLQRFFARLAVFRGGWTLEAAEQVCDLRALEALAQLQARSLIVAEEADYSSSEAMRYRMLEMLAEYAAEQLTPAERQDTERRHTEFFLHLAEQATLHLEGTQPAHWLDRVEAEMDNLHVMLDRCQADLAGGETGLRCVKALCRYWLIRGRLNEGRDRCALALAHPGAQTPDRLRAAALFTAAVLASGQGDYAQARALYEQSLAIREALGDRQGIADIRGNMGVIFHEQGDLETARLLYESAIALSKELNDERGAAIIRDCLSHILIAQGEFREARAQIEASIAYYTGLNDPVSIAYSLEHLGIVTTFEGNGPAARALHERCLALRRDIGDQRGIASSLINVATLACEQDDLQAAQSGLIESLRICRAMGDRRILACALEAAALVARNRHLPLRAAQLLGAAHVLREKIGAPLMPSERQDYDREVEHLRALAGAEAFEATFLAGQTLDLNTTVAELLEETEIALTG